jgi:AcrR family transcriptional regulator
MSVRERILDAALELFAHGGVQELTQPRVSKAAGVRQSHLTYYFPTITDLLQEVARRSLERLAGELHGGHGRPRAASLGAAIAHGAADKRRARMMLSLVAAADRDAALKPRMRAFVGELRGRIAAMLAGNGLEVDAADLAFLHSMIVGCAVLQLARDNAEARKEARAVLERAVQVIALPKAER